jgi:hypothetical protein
MGLELQLAYASREALVADHQENLRKGRAFVVGGAPSGDPAERERCRAVLVHPTTGAELVLEAEVVWVKHDPPGAGVGLQFVDFGEAQRELLRRFVEAASEAEPAPAPANEDDTVPRNLYERVRALSLTDRGIVARQGSLQERVALERCYGSAVWEGLLQNPQVTPPEVARIAKNGMLPRSAAQIIVSNAAWLALPDIQRALLSNPRVAGPHLERVLRAMPRSELEKVTSSTAYRAEVRKDAARLTRGR